MYVPVGSVGTTAELALLLLLPLLMQGLLLAMPAGCCSGALHN